MSQTNNKSHVSLAAGGALVFNGEAVITLITAGSLRNIGANALGHDLNEAAEHYRWFALVRDETATQRPDRRKTLKDLRKVAASFHKQLTIDLKGDLRTEIAKQYGLHKEGLESFREDRAALNRLTDKIKMAEESLKVPKGRLPQDPVFFWLCKCTVDLYEKHSAGKPFTHDRLEKESDPRIAFLSAGGRFAANAIMHIRPETTAAELDSAFANIVKNKKNHSDK